MAIHENKELLAEVDELLERCEKIRERMMPATFISFHILHEEENIVRCFSNKDGTCSISINYGDLDITGDPEVLIDFFIKAQRMITREIMNREDQMLEKRRANEK